MYLLGAAAAIAVLGAAPSQAAVVTLDFGTGADAFPDSPYQEDGLNVASINLRLDSFGHPGRALLLSRTVTISSISAASFSLTSLEGNCTGAGIDGCPSTFQVQGTLVGGGTTAPVTVTTSIGSSIWVTASAFAGFTNLSSLTISPGSASAPSTTSS